MNSKQKIIRASSIIWKNSSLKNGLIKITEQESLRDTYAYNSDKKEPSQLDFKIKKTTKIKNINQKNSNKSINKNTQQNKTSSNKRKISTDSVCNRKISTKKCFNIDFNEEIKIDVTESLEELNNEEEINNLNKNDISEDSFSRFTKVEEYIQYISNNINPKVSNNELSYKQSHEYSSPLPHKRDSSGITDFMKKSIGNLEENSKKTSENQIKKYGVITAINPKKNIKMLKFTKQSNISETKSEGNFING